MALVDPSKAGNVPKVGPGEKVMACVGIDRGHKNHPYVSMHWLVLVDRAATGGDRGDKGRTLFDSFTLTDAARWRIGQAAAACGRTEPFDDENDQQLVDIFQDGYVVGSVILEKGNDGVMYPKIKRYSSFTGLEGEGWADLFA